MCGRSPRLFLCSFPLFHLANRSKPGQESAVVNLLGVCTPPPKVDNSSFYPVSGPTGGSGEGVGCLLMMIRLGLWLGHAVLVHLGPEHE